MACSSTPQNESYGGHLTTLNRLPSCLPHISLQFWCIMVSAVSQMLHQDLAPSGASTCLTLITFHPRGLLNTSCHLSLFQQGKTLNHLPLFRILFQQSTQNDFKLPSIFRITTNPRGFNGFLNQLPAIESIRNVSSCFCVASGDTILGEGVSEYVAPDPLSQPINN